MASKFNIATEQEISAGMASDVYFEKSIDAASEVDFHETAVAEVTVSGPLDTWVNFSGLDEVINLLEGIPVELYSVPEGSILPPRDVRGTPVPFITIAGTYRDFGRFETSLLGFICQASGISTYSAKIRQVLADTPFYSFGIRRMHPAISPMIDRSAFVGGADGVSGRLGAKLIGEPPVGTMPHTLSLLLGDRKAWEITIKSARSGKKSILIDTFHDEKFAAIEAAEAFPEIDFVRLDTPSSRRGNFAALVREVRWELDLRDHKHVGIMASGGLRIENLKELKDAGVEAFGIGTSISSAKPFDFAMDLVEINGKPSTKRGKFSGTKNVLRCDACHETEVVPVNVKEKACHCGGTKHNLMVKFLSNGKRSGKYPTAREIRSRTLEELKQLPQSE